MFFASCDELENLLPAQGYPPVRHSWCSTITSLDELHFKLYQRVGNHMFLFLVFIIRVWALCPLRLDRALPRWQLLFENWLRWHIMLLCCKYCCKCAKIQHHVVIWDIENQLRKWMHIIILHCSGWKFVLWFLSQFFIKNFQNAGIFCAFMSFFFSLYKNNIIANHSIQIKTNCGWRTGWKSMLCIARICLELLRHKIYYLSFVGSLKGLKFLHRNPTVLSHTDRWSLDW